MWEGVDPILVINPPNYNYIIYMQISYYDIIWCELNTLACSTMCDLIDRKDIGW